MQNRAILVTELGIAIMFIRRLWADDRGQDIAEYAVMLVVVLIVTLATIRAIGVNATTLFSRLAATLDAVK
jgi:Flp pilus assembly pilin Flp